MAEFKTLPAKHIFIVIKSVCEVEGRFKREIRWKRAGGGGWGEAIGINQLVISDEISECLKSDTVKQLINR